MEGPEPAVHGGALRAGKRALLWQVTWHSVSYLWGRTGNGIAASTPTGETTACVSVGTKPPRPL